MLFWYLPFFAQNEKKIKVSFVAKIENRNSDTLMIFDIKDKIVSKMIIKNGVFQDSFETIETIHSFFDGKEMSFFFLKEGSDIELKMDAKNIWETIEYSGKASEESNYLTQRSILDQKMQSPLNELIEKDEKDFEISLDKIKKDQFAALEGKGFSEKLVELVKAKIKSDLNLLEIQYKNKKAIANLNGTPSPSFDYENHKGGKTSLESLKGKYVYIDVWATWCGPCRAEIPYLKKTEEAYHGKNIEFVSISIDRMKDHDKWKNFVTENELGGIQLFADNDWNSQFVKDYQINGIPIFILVGPKGEIVNADAPRPSSHNLVETIDSLLK